MLRFQRDLPRFPVPALDETCALYLELARPLLGTREYAATRRAVAEFVEPGGPGQALQARLLEWSSSSAPDNWLEPFWDDWYLCDDTPLVVNVSPGFALTGGDQPQIERAARLLAAALRVKALVDHEELEPDHRRRRSPLHARVRAPLLLDAGPGSSLATSSGRTPTADMSSSFTTVASSRSTCSMRTDARARYPSSSARFGRSSTTRGPQQPSPGVLTTDRRRSWAGIRERRHLQGPNRPASSSMSSSRRSSSSSWRPARLRPIRAPAKPLVCSCTETRAAAGSTSRSSSSWRRTASPASAWSTPASTGAPRCGSPSCSSRTSTRRRPSSGARHDGVAPTTLSVRADRARTRRDLER